MSELREVECEGGRYYVHQDARVDAGADIGNGTKIWAGAHVFPGAVVGSDCVIGEGVGVENDAMVGSWVKIQRGVTVYGGVDVGDYAFLGPNATTTNDRNPRSFGDWQLTRTEIGVGASIGANSTLIAGNNVGALALVGAGTVVTRPVEGGSLVLGNPGRFAGWVDVDGSVLSRDREQVPDELVARLLDPRAAIKRYLDKNKG